MTEIFTIYMLKCNFLYNVMVNYMFLSYEYIFSSKEYYPRNLIIPLESSENDLEPAHKFLLKVAWFLAYFQFGVQTM